MLLSLHSTVMVKNMKKHLRICNDRPLPPQPHFQEDVNLLKNSAKSISVSSDKKQLGDLSELEWNEWLQRIDAMYKEVMHNDEIQTSILSHPSMSEKMYESLS
jgi:hypothetical protein